MLDRHNTAVWLKMNFLSKKWNCNNIFNFLISLSCSLAMLLGNKALSLWMTSAFLRRRTQPIGDFIYYYYGFHNHVWIAVLHLQVDKWYLHDILEKMSHQRGNEELGKAIKNVLTLPLFRVTELIQETHIMQTLQRWSSQSNLISECYETSREPHSVNYKEFLTDGSA